jgi:ATPase subunit of ABC transporter with duplicated ATPase domains
LFVDDERAPVTQLVALHRSVVTAGDHPVLSDVSVVLRRDARVHLRGKNGAGKTSLVRALLRAAGPRAERMLYLPQELPAADEAVALAQLAAAAAERRARILDIVAALGVGPDRLLASARPSPGELRKLVLATGLARGVWALLLDEPTNHLDLPSIERLEQALADYPGALLLVTHDQTLAAALTDQVWAVEDGRVVVNPPAESRTA